MTILYVVSDYKNQHVSYKAGQKLELTDSEANFLLRDSPGSFSYLAPEKRGLSAPPADKMIDVPIEKKTWERMTVAQLKMELRKRGLPLIGKKKDLIERLENYA